MTCIVGLVGSDGKVYMGGDSCISGDYGYEISPRKKVFLTPTRNYLIGVAGSARSAQLIESMFLPEKSWSNLHFPNTYEPFDKVRIIVEMIRAALKEGGRVRVEDGIEQVDCNILIGHNANLYRIGNQFDITEFTRGYEAIGSGEAYALGSLYVTQALSMPPEERVMTALQAAAEFASGVRPPFYVEVVG